METKQLEEIIKAVRCDIINEVAEAKSGHPGGALSAAEILSVLYFEFMNIPSFSDPLRDRFVLSKGHASALYYAVLCEKGAFPKQELKTFRKLGSRLQGHPDMNRLEGVDMSSGSLGLGVCAAVGMALSAKIDNKSYHTYTLLGDGEIQEGSVWEAFMSASHFKLDNLTVIIDNNNLQIDGDISDVMNPYPIDEKLSAFGFYVINVDGHDINALRNAYKEALTVKGKPTCIIAKTVKGKGVSFMENDASWHGSAPNEEQREKALKEICGGEN